MSQSSWSPGHAMSKKYELNQKFAVDKRSISPICRRKSTFNAFSSMQNNVSTCSLGASPCIRGKIYKESQTATSQSAKVFNNASRNLLLSPPFRRSQISPKLLRVGTPRGESQHSLCSPLLLGGRERAASSSSAGKYGNSFPNSAFSYFDQDMAIFKQAHVINYLGVNFESRLPSFSGSELDTLSTCGHCGQMKLLDSPYLSLRTSKKHLHNEEIKIDIPMSSDIKSLNWQIDSIERDQRENKMTAEASVSSVDKHCFRPNRQPPLVRFLCWSSDREEDATNASLTKVGLNCNENPTRTAALKIMFQYCCKSKDLCVTVLNISSITKNISKPYSVYVKACLLPGKLQTQFSRRNNHTRDSVIDKKFHFSGGLQHLSQCELVIKLYNKPGIFSLPKPLGKCMIPLRQYDFSESAYIVWPIGQKNNMEASRDVG